MTPVRPKRESFANIEFREFLVSFWSHRGHDRHRSPDEWDQGTTCRKAPAGPINLSSKGLNDFHR